MLSYQYVSIKMVQDQILTYQIENGVAIKGILAGHLIIL